MLNLQISTVVLMTKKKKKKKHEKKNHAGLEIRTRVP